MEVLEVALHKDRLFKIIIIEAEHQSNCPIDMKKVTTAFLESEHYTNLIEMLIEKLNPEFVAAELNTGSKPAVKTKNHLVELLQAKNIHFKSIENPKHITEPLLTIDSILDWLWDIETEVDSEVKTSERYEHFMNLYAWYYCHKKDDRDRKKELAALVHEAGFILGILEETKQVHKEKGALFIITTHSHFLDLKKFLKKLGIEYEEQIIENFSDVCK
ncbi:MAG: hypothetical protein ACFFGZ_07915 [Candidatus Thorarchaeota archaeon]